MSATLLTESAWKSIALKHKVKDNGLLRALAAYDKMADDDHDELLDGIAEISQLAHSLRKAKEISADAAVAKFLAELIDALDAEKRDVAKDKAEAAKAEAADKKKSEAETGDKADEEEEEESEDYQAALTTAFKKLRSLKDASYQFLVCDAKPHCGLMIARKITPKHKSLLTDATGGSNRFLKIGLCRFEGGKFAFETEQPIPGLAKKLQDSIKFFTGKKMPIMVGTEAADADDVDEIEADDEPIQAIAPPRLPKPELATAPKVWADTRDILENNVKALKKAIQAQCGDEEADFVQEVDANLEKLDGIFETLDLRLAECLGRAQDAKDAGARKAELQNAKGILAEYIKYVKSEPLIAHLDENPFGVKTNLKTVLSESLTHLAKAIAT